MRQIICLSLILWSCQNNSPATANANARPPKSPEEVVLTWQKHLDNNEFEAAKKLSSPDGVEWIETIQVFLEEEPISTTTEFLNLHCTAFDSTAQCVYLFEDEDGQQIQDTFFLLKLNNQWLVDIPKEDSEMDEALLEELFDALQ